MISSPAKAILARGIKIKIKDLEWNDSSILKPFNTTKLTNFEVGV
jgi:hypothetical protein